MAIYHLAVKTVCRSAGRSATAAAAYRSGERIADERTGQVHDYTRRGGVEHEELCTAPDAPSWARDRAQLWNAAELKEKRKDARVAREFEAALPAELDQAQRQDLARQFAQALVQRYGVVADLCIHEPHAHGDERNFHVHILCTTRQVGAEGWGAKTRQLDEATKSTAELEQCRALWAELANRALERAGSQERIDHRSLAAQRAQAQEQGDLEQARSLERAPTTHLGSAAAAMERKRSPKRHSERGKLCRERLDLNQEVEQLRQELAQLDAAKEQVKQELAVLEQQTAQEPSAQAVLEHQSPTAPESEQPMKPPAQRFELVEEREAIEEARQEVLERVRLEEQDVGAAPAPAVAQAPAEVAAPVVEQPVASGEVQPAIEQQPAPAAERADATKNAREAQPTAQPQLDLEVEPQLEEAEERDRLEQTAPEPSAQAEPIQPSAAAVLEHQIHAASEPEQPTEPSAQVQTNEPAPEPHQDRAVRQEEGPQTPGAAQRPGRTYLSVPFPEREQAKAAGARFEWQTKRWYAPRGTELAPLARWLLQETQQPPESKELCTAIGFLSSPSAAPSRPILLDHPPASVLPSGDVRYELEDGGIVVDRQAVPIVEVHQVSEQSLHLALDVALVRFGGGPLLAQGSVEFQRQIGAIATERGIEVHYTDLALEAARLAAQRPAAAQFDQKQPPAPRTPQNRAAQERETRLAEYGSLTTQQLDKRLEAASVQSIQELVGRNPEVRKAAAAVPSRSVLDRAEREYTHCQNQFGHATKELEAWRKEHPVWTRIVAWGIGQADDLAALEKQVESATASLCTAQAKKEALEVAAKKAKERLEAAEDKARPAAEAEHARQKAHRAEIALVLKKRQAEKVQLEPKTPEQLIAEHERMIAVSKSLAEKESLRDQIARERGQLGLALQKQKLVIQAWRAENPKRAWAHDKGWKQSKTLAQLEGSAQELEEQLKAAGLAERAALWHLKEIQTERLELRKELAPWAKEENAKQVRAFQLWRERYEPEQLRQERQRTRQWERSRSQERGQSKGRGRGD